MDSRAGKVLAVVVGVLVLLAVVAGVISATRDQADLPAGSPEAAVQDYVAQVYDGNADAAAAHLAPDSACTVEDLTSAYAEPATRVVLRDSTVDGDRATVRLDFVRGGDGPFQTEWTQQETFRLTSADGSTDWVITGVPWPMPGCGTEWRP